MVIFQVLVYPCRTPLSGASGFLYIIRDFPKKMIIRENTVPALFKITTEVKR